MVSKAKPNPRGKDKSRQGEAPAAQLAAEWVDIKNVSNSGVELKGLGLYHKAYARDGTWKWDLVRAMPTFTLPAGETLRVHSGSGPLAIVREEDKVGCHWHVFTGRDEYVWNNDYGDTALLWYIPEKKTIDSASYDPYPPDGAVLVRVGDKLVVGTSAYSNV
jgi:hypothetical protein